ncbi:MAG: putative toxin-antitoxin system toxin component, PIN family [Thermodesulfovibrionales bacterium]|nr:putative toxin-antitoxin system toxin component, PIN family [Thermodesulfovibrionales bacterium]
MLKVVFDTNVYVSAFTSPNSKAEDAYLLAVRGKVELYTSVSILTELARKLREKFQWDDSKVKAALKHISKVATVIKPAIKITLLQDETDNRILECAKASNANLIVTGDKHLLSLKKYSGVGITRIAGFLYIFENKDKSTT